MGEVDLVLVVMAGGVLALLVGAVVGLYLYRGREHRSGMARFREACRARGLSQGPEMWETSIDGVRVGVRCLRYGYLADSSVNRNYYRWDNSYLALITPTLSLGLDAFARTQRNLAAPDGYSAYPDMWQRKDRPERVRLAGNPLGGRLHIHAADPVRAAAVVGHPDVVELIAEAIDLCKDVRVTDTSVELLDEPYETGMAALDHRLRLAAGIAARLSTALRGAPHR